MIKLRKIVFYYICLFCFPIFGYGQLSINEFSSKGSVEDFYGKTNDWVELINVGNSPIHLSNYFLSDKINNTFKWQLPDIKLSSMEKILILNSGEDKKYRVSHWESILNEYSQLKYFLGINAPDSNWHLNINDSTWAVGVNGVGFGDNDDSTIVANTSSLYLRYLFHITNKEDITKLLLHSDYDDSFIAYLNGVEIARSNNIYGVPITYQTLATSAHEAVKNSGEEFERCYFSKVQLDTLLQIGDNVLAIEVHDFDSIPDDMSARFFLNIGVHSDTNYFFNASAWLDEEETYYHSNFKLSEGEEIIVSDSNGNIIDQKSINSSNTFISEGRSPDGIGNWCYFSTPTPGFSNDSSNCFNGISSKPIISLNSGWYANQQHVTIISSNSTQIFYTTNGDVPDTTDNLYSDTLYFDSTTVLSVRAFSSNNLPSKVVDRTYIINEDNYGLPVFSIITDSLNLWDWNTGIYVLGPNANLTFPYRGANYWQPWSKWSRLEFFDKNKNKQAEEEFDLEIHGGFSRAREEQKSFRLDFKSKYTGNIDYPLISQKSFITEYNNINLRNGGNNARKDKIKDALFSSIASDINIDVMGYEACILYLNGKYWGLYGIREKIDESYIEDNYGINSDSVDLINAHPTHPKIYSGSDIHFIDTYHLLMDADPFAPSFINLIEERFDIDNFLDYFILETYIGNWDWVPNSSNNLRLWRPQSQGGKWRYLLHDTDLGFNWSATHSFNQDYIFRTLNPNSISKHSELLNKFLQNSDFKCRFANRYADVINTLFEVDYFRSKVNILKNNVVDAIPRHVEKWPSPYYQSVNDWEDLLDKISDDNEYRINYALQHVSDNLQLDSIVSLSLDIFPGNSGRIKINSITPNTFPWLGFFFKSQCPSKISALADSSYIFSHWEQNLLIGSQQHNADIEILISQNDTIVANFRECTIHNLSVNLDSIGNYLSPEFNIGYGPYSYQWFFNDDIMINANDSIFFPTKTGFYNVSVIDKDGCNKFSDSIFFNCNTLVYGILTQDSISNSLDINCLGGKHPYSYQWFIDSIPIESLNQSSLDVYTYGTYYAIIEDINGCRSFTDTISNKRLDVNIFPNPTNRLMNIQFIRLYGEEYIISVFDLHMNILHYIELPMTDHNMFYTHTFNLDIDITGLYFIKLESSNSKIARRFIYLE